MRALGACGASSRVDAHRGADHTVASEALGF